MRAKKYTSKRVTYHVPIEKIVKAFANKKRIDILYLLNKHPDSSVDTISASLDFDYKTTSAHTSKLAIAGLIKKKHIGHTVVHKLTTRGKQVLEFFRTLE